MLSGHEMATAIQAGRPENKVNQVGVRQIRHWANNRGHRERGTSSCWNPGRNREGKEQADGLNPQESK
jgi:hypothetical protein